MELKSQEGYSTHVYKLDTETDTSVISDNLIEK